MLCDRESLFTNITRVPMATWMFFGLVPAAVIVIVFVTVGGAFEGAVVELPQATHPASRSTWTERTDVTRRADLITCSILPARDGQRMVMVPCRFTFSGSL